MAAQLGVSRTWLYEAAKIGRIPSIRIGGKDGPLRFVYEDLERWIDDARAAWHPGRSAVPTRVPEAVGRSRQTARGTRPSASSGSSSDT